MQKPQSLCTKISIDTASTIAAYGYNHNGQTLAVTDTDGTVLIHKRQGDNFTLASYFNLNQSAIWSLAFADPIYGQLLGIGTFKKKMSIMQNIKEKWVQVATYDVQQAAINHVEWVHPAYGLSLYGCTSDGMILSLQLKKNVWVTNAFAAHDTSIHTFALQPLPLTLQSTSSTHPLLATAGRDMCIKVWKHVSMLSENQVLPQSRCFQLVVMFRPHSEPIRCLLFKKQWDLREEYTLISGSEDGVVQQTTLPNQTYIKICQHQGKILKLSQSMTGNLLSVTVAGKESTNYIYQEIDTNNWVVKEKIN